MIPRVSRTRVYLISVFVALIPSAWASAGSQSSATLKEEVRDQMTARRFSGAVLVAHDGSPLFELATGEADRETHQPNTVDTKFRFGSMGKMFTSVAIAQLVEAGKVGYQDPLSRYLPDYANKDVSRVTIEQLLTHIAGTGDIFGPEFIEHREELKELQDYVGLYSSRPLLFEPGSRHEYSNFGFILLGRVVEVASGQSYYDYVREHIFLPAAMNATDNAPEISRVSHLAVAYTDPNHRRGPEPKPRSADGNGAGIGARSQAGGDRWPPGPNTTLVRADPLLPYRGTSAGGGYSTVDDLLKFANALMSNQLLNAKLTDMIVTGKVDTPMPGLKYAFGFEDATLPGRVRRIGHGGGAPGMNGVLWIFPETRDVIVVLANLDPPIAQELAQSIVELLQLH